MAAHLMYELLAAAKGPKAQDEALRQNLRALIAWVTGSEQGRDLSGALAQGEALGGFVSNGKGTMALALAMMDVRYVMHAQTLSCMLCAVFCIACVWNAGAMQSTEGRGFRDPAEFM